MSSAVSRGDVAFESSSDQISCRRPVRALMSTIGWSRSKERPRSVIGTAPLRANASGVSRPGTLVTMSAPGLNPSARL